MNRTFIRYYQFPELKILWQNIIRIYEYVDFIFLNPEVR